ncbi:hypothetical protein QJQ45_027145 [Haematococcus lacustris]|nr:hypothetical protein QJQ45_027145 [Haematococcus lacustris]
MISVRAAAADVETLMGHNYSKWSWECKNALALAGLLDAVIVAPVLAGTTPTVPAGTRASVPAGTTPSVPEGTDQAEAGSSAQARPRAANPAATHAPLLAALATVDRGQNLRANAFICLTVDATRYRRNAAAGSPTRQQQAAPWDRGPAAGSRGRSVAHRPPTPTVRGSSPGRHSAHLAVSSSNTPPTMSFAAIDVAAAVTGTAATATLLRTQWLLDSGCSRHLTCNLDLLHDYQPTQPPHVINVANGAQMTAWGEVSVRFSTAAGEVVLLRVMHVCCSPCPAQQADLSSQPPCAPQQLDNKVAKGILVGCELGCRSYRVQGKISKNVVMDGEVELRRSAPAVVEDESEQQAAPAVAAPTNHHQAATGLLRYLKRTAAWGLVYSSSGSSQLQGYADADYAGDPDSMRSTSGTVFVLNGAAISWRSQLQTTVAASTTEAETQAAAAATKEALFLRKVLHHLGASCDPIPIFCDNQGAVALIKNPVECSRSRHIAVAHHLTRERQARGEVVFTHCPSTEMLADALTKPLSAQLLNGCVRGMGVS